MSKPIWLLDVDGVIGPFGRPEWPDEPVDIRVWGMPFGYSPMLIQAINMLSAYVEVRWLTSWEHAAADHLAPALGLPGFPVQERSGLQGKEWASDGLHWKAVEAMCAIDEHRPVIWTDDDAWAPDDVFDAEWVAGEPTHTEMLVRNHAARCNVSLLMIEPDRTVGLTPEHCRTIAEFVSAPLLFE